MNFDMYKKTDNFDIDKMKHNEIKRCFIDNNCKSDFLNDKSLDINILK